MRRLLFTVLALVVAFGCGSACYQKGNDQTPGASGGPGY
jgi:hypothetical protein